MSKYEKGDKVVMEITGVSKYGECYEVAHTSMWNTIRTERVTEPLFTYTEPLEDKIKKLMEENIRLIAENTKLKAKDDVLKTSCDDYEEKVNDMCDTARAEGQEEAWELAKKFVLYGKGCYSDEEVKKIFGFACGPTVLRNYTYKHAAAKVSEWEKAKEEIKVGDVLEDIADNNVKCVVTKPHSSNMAYLVFGDGSAGLNELDNLRKTGRHTNIDSFLKQIGGEKNEDNL